jgi:hypothetical protein
MKKLLLIALPAAALLLVATPTFAGFAVSVSGNANLVSPPPANAAADTNVLYQVWNESQGTLSSAVALENNGLDGSYSGASPGSPTTLAAGTSYGTTMIQLNPGIDGPVGSGSATIMFSSPIIGIALSAASLDATDKYGAPGTTYPSTDAGRGILGKVNSLFTISDGGLELTVHFTAQFDSLREIRVFTEGSKVSTIPEPASLVVWSLVGGVAACGQWIRRRRSAV